MTQTEIEEYITQFPIYQYAFVKPEDIEFNDRVRQICKKECSRYGASCPARRRSALLKSVRSVA